MTLLLLWPLDCLFQWRSRLWPRWTHRYPLQHLSTTATIKIPNAITKEYESTVSQLVTGIIRRWSKTWTNWCDRNIFTPTQKIFTLWKFAKWRFPLEIFPSGWIFFIGKISPNVKIFISPVWKFSASPSISTLTCSTLLPKTVYSFLVQIRKTYQSLDCKTLKSQLKMYGVRKIFMVGKNLLWENFCPRGGLSAGQGEISCHIRHSTYTGKKKTHGTQGIICLQKPENSV